jgi:hypothetical protein
MDSRSDIIGHLAEEISKCADTAARIFSAK